MIYKKIASKTSRQWFDYFHNHKDTVPSLPKVDYLTDEERIVITKSIQQFQKGESSAGHNLRRKAKLYSQQSNDPYYEKAIDLFIQEEQRHSVTLLNFMQAHKIIPIRAHWVDSIFRKLRRPFGLEQMLSVLLTAELIAMVYYNYLSLATKSPLLKAICKQILIDETQHIQFQSSFIHKARQTKNRSLNFLRNFLLKFFLSGTIFIVWCFHKIVLQKAGKSFSEFRREVFSHLEYCLLIINA